MIPGAEKSQTLLNMDAGWPAFDSVFSKLNEKKAASCSIRSGLSYFYVKALLSGRSILAVCAEEEEAALLYENACGLASLFPESKKWSLGTIHANVPEQKNALLEEGRTQTRVLWFTYPEA